MICALACPTDGRIHMFIISSCQYICFEYDCFHAMQAEVEIAGSPRVLRKNDKKLCT